MRVTTWNCFRGSIRERLQRLAPLNADLVVLEECRRPAEQLDLPGDGEHRVIWNGINDEQGVAVATLSPALNIERLSLTRSFPTIASVLVHAPTPFVLVGVWTLPGPTYSAMALAAMKQCCAAATGLPVVAAGDFNISPGVGGQERSAPAFFKQMREEFGLVSAYHSFFGVEPGCEAHPTYYHRRHESEPFHLDYCFVPEGWAANVTRVEVGSYSEWNDSDHRPLTIHIDI